jgi:competence protein ComGC
MTLSKKFKFTNKVNLEAGMTLVEVLVSIMISTSLILGVGQIMRSSFSTLDYIADQSVEISEMNSLKTAMRNDVEDSEVIVVSAAMTGGDVSSQSDCTTGTVLTGVNGSRSVLPLFSTFFTTVQGRDTSGFKLAHGAGFEIRLSQDGKSGEIWRVYCEAVVNLTTSQNYWKPDLVKTAKLASGVALPYEKNSSVVSKWFENSFSSGLYGVSCITFEKSSQNFVLAPCQYGVEYARSSGQSSNGVRGLVLRVWNANGDLSEDLIAARRLT